MKAMITAAILVVVAACGQSQGGPVASTSASPSPSVQPLFAALQAKGTANAWTYNTVAIFGLDGRQVASATFTPMPVPKFAPKLLLFALTSER